jgi:hypothetical protein
MKIDSCFLIILFLKIKSCNKLTIRVKPHLLQMASLLIHRDHYWVTTHIHISTHRLLMKSSANPTMHMLKKNNSSARKLLLMKGWVASLTMRPNNLQKIWSCSHHSKSSRPNRYQPFIWPDGKGTNVGLARDIWRIVSEGQLSTISLSLCLSKPLDFTYSMHPFKDTSYNRAIVG